MRSAYSVTDKLTVAVCCYNAAHYLDTLVERLASLDCPNPFEILIVDNNSTDETKQLIETLSKKFQVPIRYVQERKQGIPFARNKAIEESRSSRYLAFIDADEIPDAGWLNAAMTAFANHNADCVGGAIDVDLPDRPNWLTDSLMLFLGQVDYGSNSFRITDQKTPVWSGNIAYRTEIFSSGLTFDSKYNREKNGIGGGEDSKMFREILDRGMYIRYEPKMRITHLIPTSKLQRSYFLKLHFVAGKKTGLYEIQPTRPLFRGVPHYMFLQLFRKIVLSVKYFLMRHREYVREAMNASHQTGVMIGLYIRYKTTGIDDHVIY